MSSSSSSSPPPLQFILLLLLFFFLLPSSTSSPIPNCTPSTCNNSTLQIPYPFYLSQTSPNPYCGYPNLILHCLNNNPTIALPNAGNYTITAFNISSQTLSLFDTAAISHTNCPQPLHNLSIYSNFYDSTLSYTSEDTQLFFYYNCSKTLTAAAVPLRCGEGGKASYVLTVDAVLPVADCEENVVAPVLHAAVLWGGGFLSGDLVGVMKEGFQLHWDGGGGEECPRCEGSGGKCGRGMEGFVCFCESGINELFCGEGKVAGMFIFDLLFMSHLLSPFLQQIKGGNYIHNPLN